MKFGTITTVKPRGFGFIRPDDGGAETFFHASALVGLTFEQATPGLRVVYEVEATGDGRERAVGVESQG